jgi:hypothetical protein
MSENVIIPTNDEPKTFPIVKIMATRARGLEALAAASADNLDPATLCTRYNKAIQLARTLNASENLTERFATLLSDTETLTNRRPEHSNRPADPAENPTYTNVGPRHSGRHQCQQWRRPDG